MLFAYRQTLQKEVRAEYRHSVMVWAVLAPNVKDGPPAPDLPAILRE